MTAKYASDAVPLLIRMLRITDADIEDARAILVGGASVLGNKNAADVGKRNAEVASTQLATWGIEIVRRDIGGVEARNVVVDCRDEIVIASTVRDKGSYRSVCFRHRMGAPG